MGLVINEIWYQVDRKNTNGKAQNFVCIKRKQKIQII